MLHRTCPVNYSRAESRSWRVQSRSPLEHRTLSGVAPDSPVNYSKAPLKIPEGDEFSLRSPGAPDTVRCARPGSTSVSFAPFLLNSNLFFLLVCFEPLAPVECIILNKLVSPLICVGQFNHQNQLGKGLTLFPFQSPPFW